MPKADRLQRKVPVVLGVGPGTGAVQRAYHTIHRSFARQPCCPFLCPPAACVFHRFDQWRRQDEEGVAVSLPALWDAVTYTGKNAALLRNLASVYPEVGDGLRCAP